MGAPETDKMPHSGEYFGEQRDFWWNVDFLKLMAERWRLDRVESVLDVGCGVGHWGQLLLPLLAPGSRLTGVDREGEWVEQAAKRAKARGWEKRCTYQKGSAEKLDFSDGSFDLVTCQTVLIHLKDPGAAVREFTRVLKPGGLLAVSEPNNFAQAMVRSNLDFHEPIEQRLAVAEFQLLCERGKELLGEGNNSIGDIVPWFFTQAGLSDIRVFMSDKATPFIPPYESPDEQALLKQQQDWSRREFWIWDRDDTLRYFLAGGGKESAFEAHWAAALESVKRDARHKEQLALCTAGGGMSYLISGHKRA